MTTVKIVAVLAIVSALVGFVTWCHSEVKQSGYNACVAAQEQQTTKFEVNEIDKLKQKIALMNKKSEADELLLSSARQSIKLMAVERGRLENDITQYKAPDACKHLGDEFQRVFNASIGTKPNI